jgi:hypothetical protein
MYFGSKVQLTLATWSRRTAVGQAPKRFGLMDRQIPAVLMITQML